MNDIKTEAEQVQDVIQWFEWIREKGFQFELARQGTPEFEKLDAPLQEVRDMLVDCYDAKPQPVEWVLRFIPSGRLRTFPSHEIAIEFALGFLTCTSEMNGNKPFLASFDGELAT